MPISSLFAASEMLIVFLGIDDFMFVIRVLQDLDADFR